MADKLSRRDFMKKAGLTIAGGSLAGIGGLVGGNRHLSRLIAAYWQEMSRNHCAAAPVPDTVLLIGAGSHAPLALRNRIVENFLSRPICPSVCGIGSADVNACGIRECPGSFWMRLIFEKTLKRSGYCFFFAMAI